ncbi:folate-binding protein YgfZ [Endozoicomonas sp. OPT23]|uniref:CAF17-like 4Fe-4S cluster assembly/insertion protein YgfZ n=1 Tax=Endozoicomonas sp. OPT23 TaxID=2072845 RepID=UPI00189121B6|nr:folate-binding protein YgfZ [Endozoicomonas sp. OPT23]
MITEREEHLKNFLTEQGAHYQEQQLNAFEGYSQPADRHAPTLSILDHKAIIESAGPDTFKFLQGQLTCDTSKLSTGQYQTGTVCTPKGRMYSQFSLLKTSDESCLMAMHEGLTETTRTNLGKYAVFFKTELQQKEELYCIGLSGSDIKSAVATVFGNVPEGNQAIQIDDNGWLLEVAGLCQRYEAWLNLDRLTKLWPELVKHFTPTNQQNWRLLDIEAVTPALTPAVVENYIPQHFNQPSLGSVSFRKGCYTGQEIVARMQNLGQLKTRCYRLTTTETVELKANTKLFNEARKAIGEVVDCVRRSDTTELLAVIRVDAAESNTVQTESGQPLTCHTLPYGIDPKAELQQ